MPIKSSKQWGLMQAAKHGTLRGPGPSPEVAEEFIHKTSASKRSEYAKVLGRKKRKKRHGK